MNTIETRGQAQYRISQQRIDAMVAWLNEQFPQIREQLTQGCIDLYNEMLSSLGEKQKSTPADLFKLDSYWELQKNSRELLQSFGEEMNEQVNAHLRLTYIEIYEGCRPGLERVCEVSEKTIQKVIHEARGKAERNSQGRVWANLTFLWDGLFAQLMYATIKHRPVNKLLSDLQKQMDESERALKTTFSDGTTYVQARAVARRIKDDRKRQDEKIKIALMSWGNEEVSNFGIMTTDLFEDEDEGEGEDWEDEEDEAEEMASHSMVQCFSANDGWECEPCMDLNGIVWDEDEYGPAPVPVHPNCRCWIEAFENPFQEAADSIAEIGAKAPTLGAALLATLIVSVLSVASGIYEGAMSAGSPEDWLAAWGGEYPC